MKTRYAVYGSDKTYRWLWLACLVAGVMAAKARYKIDEKTTEKQK
jgi:hypothetical protein